MSDDQNRDDQNRDRKDPLAQARDQPFTTHPGRSRGTRPPRPGHSVAPGLRPVPGSTVPANADGSEAPHVFGPNQAAVDPVAAGLDWEHSPPTRNEDRRITQTGELGAGPRPATYAEKQGDVPQAAPADGVEVDPPSEESAQASPGPTGSTE